jgi:hypothetical protein
MSFFRYTTAFSGICIFPIYYIQLFVDINQKVGGWQSIFSVLRNYLLELHDRWFEFAIRAKKYRLIVQAIGWVANLHDIYMNSQWLIDARSLHDNGNFIGM